VSPLSRRTWAEGRPGWRGGSAARPALRSAASPAAGSRFTDARARNHGHREPEYL